MKVGKFKEIIKSDFFSGVPDSQLKVLCDQLMIQYGISREHIIAANEGNSVALAAGYYLATGKVPVVYLQNSGIGNTVNPVLSLTSKKVYAIPMIFIIGWRGEPGVHDEPQHIHQGEVTLELLKVMDIEYFVVDKDTTEDDIQKKMHEFSRVLKDGRSVAFVIKKGALEKEEVIEYKNDNILSRETIIEKVTETSGDDLIVSTTGKASRELFEIREKKKQSHKYDFLTVGSMGHASSIALGIALYKPSAHVWCIDGDGAMLMHLGAMAVIGANRPNNMIHVVINNFSHETVGGMPTVSQKIDFVKIAEGCGYPYAASVESMEELEKELRKAIERNTLALIEVRAAIGSRADLGRPTTTAKENKDSFVKYLNTL